VDRHSPEQPRLLDAPATAEDHLTGSVERVTFHNEENGFSVLRVQVRGRRELVTVVGHAAAIAPGEFVALLLEAKVARGELSTAKGRRTWTDAQTLHLVPHFGDRDLESIKRRDIEDWENDRGWPSGVNRDRAFFIAYERWLNDRDLLTLEDGHEWESARIAPLDTLSPSPQRLLSGPNGFLTRKDVET
jgi:hypothetical protein